MDEKELIKNALEDGQSLVLVSDEEPGDVPFILTIYIGEGINTSNFEVPVGGALILFPENGCSQRKQAEWGDNFIELVKDQSVTVVTHSEVLVLRIRRRIAEAQYGELPEGMLVKPANIRFKHISQGGKIENLQFDKFGDFDEKFSDPGYFAQDIDEIMVITNLVMKEEEAKYKNH